MGRPLFNGFLTAVSDRSPGRERGLHFDGEFASWDSLLARGRKRASEVRPQQAYLIDATRGFEAFVSFFAVASVADTLLLWARAAPELGTLHELAPALYRIDGVLQEPIHRPLWGILTSGSTGAPKVPVGYADTLELVALHYDAAVFSPTFADVTRVETLATCLPLQFSAAFFMAILPAVFLRRDLLVFAPHDWRPLWEVAQREHVICQSVPSVTAAGSLSAPEPMDMSRAGLLLGAGYITHERVRTIRNRFRDVVIANIYGTAETGAISLDREPGHSTHIGYPIPGKPVWLEETNAEGIGVIATTGVDCRNFYWQPGGPLQPTGDVVASTDYGHFDEQGHIYLDGRVDAGEKLHGITIYPRIIERHLLQLDGVIDARVLITHQANGREQLTARVVGRVSEADVREHCSVLEEIQRPTNVECISESASESAYTAHGKL
ncbi:MAG TPA: AMP-binding protein [Pyrinomonadaceae bacterium]|nr:AMP-binding protein [Pyrinomonadaceae bacterium]